MDKILKITFSQLPEGKKKASDNVLENLVNKLLIFKQNYKK